MPKSVFISGGAGRIGRAVTYEFAKKALPIQGINSGLMHIVGINDLVGIDKLVESLTGRDPVHGVYDWKVKKLDNSTIEIKGWQVKVFSERDPAKIPFRDMGVWMVAECSGFYGDPKVKDKAQKLTTADSLSQVFLQNGVEKVLQTYPAKTADISLIMGVNHQLYNPKKHRIISNASCTTKSLAMPLQMLIDNGFDVEDLAMVTVHAATNSQGILASLNQIVTHSTGAAKATGEVIPILKGKMHGTSARVPTLDGSVSYLDVTASSDKELTTELVNQIFRENYQNTKYEGRVGIIEGEGVGSADIVGRRENALIIPAETNVRKLPFTNNGKNVYRIWIASGYDNELGSSVDPVLLAGYIAM